MHVAPRNSRIPRFLNWVKEDGVDVSISAVEIGKLIADAASSSPYVGMAFGILGNILKLISKDKANRELELRIVQRCARFLSAVSAHGDVQNISQLPCFKQFEADLEKIQHLIETNPRTPFFRFKRLISADNYAAQLQYLQTMVGDALDIFQSRMSMGNHNILQDLSSRLQHQNTSSEAHISDVREEDIPVIKPSTIQLEREIVVASGTRVHSARLRGDLVIVKSFERTKDKENFDVVVKSYRDMRHPNILQFRGRSPINEPEPFIVYYATDTQGTAVEHVAETIPTEVTRIFKVGAKLVADLAAALDYLRDHSISIPPISSENYSIVMDGDKAVLSVNTHESSDSEPASPINSSDKGLSMLGQLCSQIFNSANEILYRDYSALDDNITELKPSSASVGTQSVRTDGDQTHGNLRNSGKMPDAPPVPPRREIKWKMLSYDTITLKHLSQQYRNVLISSTPLNRAIRSVSDHRILHRCRGYRREEVTFTASVMNCKVITSTTPFLHEICSVCGERVEEGMFDCICGKPDDGATSTFQCTKCSVWGHSRCKEKDTICSRCVSSNVNGPLEAMSPGDNNQAEMVSMRKTIEELEELERELAIRYDMAGFGEIDSVEVYAEVRHRALSGDGCLEEAQQMRELYKLRRRRATGWI